ncbi:hypothetical protein M433DRAFT_142206 [Acidomyces richmondensis BFW]|nr:hypothetical protein M433DRAFT_142206 [Acidomyces richmondensis BFW]
MEAEEEVGSAQKAARPKNRRRRAELKCERCQRCFSKPEHLMRHERVHSGSKPFICHYVGCEKRFNRQDSLVRHGKTHISSASNGDENEISQSPLASVEIHANDRIADETSFSEVQTGHRQMYFPTPATADASSTEYLSHFVKTGPFFWPESEDLFAMLTSDPINWTVDAQQPILDMSMLGTPRNTTHTPGQLDSPSFDAQQAMNRMKYLVRDVSFNLSQEVESTGVTTEFLDTCLNCFFSRFIPIFPVMHQPTFQLRDCTPPLLLNMIALGSLFLSSDVAVIRGETLWRLAHTAVATSWQSMLNSSDGEASGMGMQLVLTALLGQSYAVLSRNRSIRLTSHVFHGLGFYWARQSGLVVKDPWQNMLSSIGTSIDNQTLWRSWAAAEVRNRALLGHYILDGLISQSSGLPNSARHTINNMPLPCSDEIFDAKTEDIWIEAMKENRQFQSSNVRLLLVDLFNFDKPFTSDLLPHMAVPAILEALQSLISENHEAGGPSVGLPSREDLGIALWRLFASQIRHHKRPSADALDLSIRWHMLCISLCVDLNNLIHTLCLRKDIQPRLYTKSNFSSGEWCEFENWKKSHLARRAVLHALSIISRIQHLPLGKIQALHLPLALHTSAIILIAVGSDSKDRIHIPDSVCWQTVCDIRIFDHATDEVSDPNTAWTKNYLLAGQGAEISVPRDRNFLQEIHIIQGTLRSFMSIWGVAKDMYQLIDQLMTVSP